MIQIIKDNARALVMLGVILVASGFILNGIKADYEHLDANVSGSESEGNEAIIEDLANIGDGQVMEVDGTLTVVQYEPDSYPLCDLALKFPGDYVHLSEEEKDNYTGGGYDPRLYCPDNKLPEKYR